MHVSIRASYDCTSLYERKNSLKVSSNLNHWPNVGEIDA